MTDQCLQEAKSAVEEILTALDVARVVNVDDANDKEVSVEEVIASALVLDELELLAAFPDLSVIPGDKDALRQKMRDVWDRLDASTRTLQGNAVLVAARRHDGDTEDDVADSFILSDLIPRNKLTSLSPSQWESQKEQILQESTSRRTLFLFDQDLSGAGGGNDGGIRIIASLLARSDTANLLCGLLTHTVSPETQFQRWEQLSEEHSISKDRFLVIPKLHLSQEPILFAQILKFTALLPDFSALKSETKEIIAKAATVAANRVENINIYDLDHIVFRVSADEGLWEPDMLFRLHALFHRLEARRLAYGSDSLESIAAKLRAVSEIPTHSGSFAPPSSAWALQQEELYELADHVNSHHLPLEVGDIFERVGAKSSKQFILLAQPCDLMVRNNGKRQPELVRVPVAEVVTADKTPHYAEELPYFGNSQTERWYVRLKLVHFVRACILDLCVFNKDGVARLIFDGDAPTGMRPAWTKRHGVLKGNFRSAVAKADSLLPVADESRDLASLRKKIANEIGEMPFEDDLFKGSLTTTNGIREIKYDCRRIGRVSRARAFGLLMSYTSALGRPAYDVYFGSRQLGC